MTEPQVLVTRIHEDGTQSAQALSTPKSDQRGCEMHVLPTRTIPVVFLPGIMGTHLKLSSARQAELKKNTNVSWRPEATMETIAMIFKDAHQRQKILDPDATEVDRYEFGNPESDKRHKNVVHVAYVNASNRDQLSAEERDQYARIRGWSEVFFDSYGTLLQDLEQRLNQMCKLGKPDTAWKEGALKILDVSPGDWGGDGGDALTEDQLIKISDAWYPVHAVGYNWLRSNGDSAKEVAQRIREIIQYYKDRKFKCEKVIVVTHSMGGLVGRALIHPEYGNAMDLVAGIIHGAMPAVGAAAAYKRIRVGFEGSGLMGYLFKKVVGDTGPKVTAVLANAPGGLELLPSERYGTDWLKAELNGGEVLSLPKSDPYTEIYTVQDKWYRLITPEWVNPANSKTSSLILTFKKLDIAQALHQSIGNYYHPLTYLSYGADDKQKAWGNVTWRATKAPFLSGGAGQHLGLEKLDVFSDASQWKSKHDDGTGTAILTDGLDQQPFGVEIQPPDIAGDGTVPAERSAQDPVRQGKAKISYKQVGYEHQGSYQNDKAIASTLHGICKIAHDAFTWWE